MKQKDIKTKEAAVIFAMGGERGFDGKLRTRWSGPFHTESDTIVFEDTRYSHAQEVLAKLFDTDTLIRATTGVNYDPRRNRGDGNESTVIFTGRAPNGQPADVSCHTGENLLFVSTEKISVGSLEAALAGKPVNHYHFEEARICEDDHQRAFFALVDALAEDGKTAASLRADFNALSKIKPATLTFEQDTDKKVIADFRAGVDEITGRIKATLQSAKITNYLTPAEINTAVRKLSGQKIGVM